MALSHSKIESKETKSNISNQLTDLYLKHLGLDREKPSYAYLCKLQKQHIETIPHENTDGMFNFYCSFEIPHLLNKYIKEKRGGLCFELNFSFGWLLHQLGFQVEMILANVQAFNHNKEANPYPTHPILIVYLNDQRFLTDAGWSDSYRNPIPFSQAEYSDQTGKYRVCEISEKQLAMQKWLDCPGETDKFDWFNQFVFEKPKGPIQQFTYPKGFLAANAYTHVGRGYLFTNLFKFSRMNPNGHHTIWDNNLLTRDKDVRTHTELKKDIPTTLREEFKVSFDVANKCVKLKRSVSMLFPYKPIQIDTLIDKSKRKVRSVGIPF